MIEVTKAQFFAAIGGPEDIHPRSEPDHSLWLNQVTHEVVGRTEPGYKEPRNSKRYLLSQRFAQAKGVAR